MKSGLENIEVFCQDLGNPHTTFKTIHVAGTNGKGSSSHLLAAVLQSAGYKTGLYTSPHIKDFRERIRINGEMIPKQKVVSFVENHTDLFDQIQPSFFELTVAMAFDYFAKEQVDIAVIEVGLGGRLDSTNIITPLVSLITNIGYDHSYLLGDTLELIAGEKAGIIKPAIPVVIGERHSETENVFIERAKASGSPIVFAQEEYQVADGRQPGSLQVMKNGQLQWESLEVQLTGPYQSRNIPGVLTVLDQLSNLGYPSTGAQIQEGFNNVVELTGIKGRWQILKTKPMVICDTGHNRQALELLIDELENIRQGVLHMVLGFVNDKDLNQMLELLPQKAKYYFCSASVPRSTDAHKLAEMAHQFDIIGSVIPDPNRALAKAIKAANKEDIIFVGGSTFVVAELDLLI